MKTFLIFFLMTTAAWAKPEKICKTESIMATAWTICLYDAKYPPEKLNLLITEGMDIIREVDGWMSEWKPQSLISQINDQAGVAPVTVSDDALEAIELSLKHSELTGGAFDITFNAFFGQYKWKKGEERFPSDNEIKKLLPLVNYKNVIVDKKLKTVFLKNKGMKIGLGGMGQGWTVDRVVKKLKEKNIQAGFVDGSGDTYFWGQKPDGILWTVGIGDPRPLNPKPGNQDVLYKMYLTDQAVTTSGDTEKFFIRDGKRFHHIIDPHTGQSAEKLSQVTAICKTATLCDLADGGIFVLGPIEGRKYAEKIGVEAVMVTPDKKITMTKGLHVIDTKWGPALKLQ